MKRMQTTLEGDDIIQDAAIQYGTDDLVDTSSDPAAYLDDYYEVPDWGNRVDNVADEFDFDDDH